MGGEFNKGVFRQMEEKLNIETCIKSQKSPLSNGTAEHHDLKVTEAMENTLNDEKCEPEIALVSAVRAKNILQSHSGSSPKELVFEFNINIRLVLTD